MTYLNPQIFLLDPVLHTFGENAALETLQDAPDAATRSQPDRVRSRSALLLSVIICKALKFLPTFPHYEAVLRNCLRATEHMLLASLTSSPCLIETIQAIVISTEFKEPDDDRGYLLLGMVGLPV
jgi:hypothetical protein